MKPTGADLSLLYTCPKCGQVHPASIKETKFPGGVLCYCGNQITFDTIYHVDLKIDYIGKGKSKGGALDKPAKQVYNGPIGMKTNVIDGLVKLGYRRGLVRERYKTLLPNLPDPSNEQDVINRLLKVL